MIGDVVARLDALEREGRDVTLFVTTDHGRALNFRDHGSSAPESALVWLVASGSRIAKRGYFEAPSPHHLSDLAPTLRVLLGLPADRTPTAGRVLDELITSEAGPTPFAFRID